MKESNSTPQEALEKTLYTLIQSARPHPKAKRNGLWFGVMAVIFSNLLVNLFIFFQH